MSSLNAQVGVADESVFGTFVPPTLFPEFNSEGIESEYARVESNGLRAGRAYRSASRFSTYFAGAAGDLEMEVGTKGFGFFLKHMLGSISNTAAVDGLTTFTAVPPIDEAVFNAKTMSCQVYRPYMEGGGATFSYGGGKVASWELSCEAGGNLMSKLSLDFSTEDTTAAKVPATFAAGVETLAWVGGTVTVGGVQFDVSSATVTGDNGIKTDRRYLRGTPNKKLQIVNDYRSGEFTLKADFDSLAQRDRVASVSAAGTLAQIVLKFEALTAVGAVKPSLTLTLPEARFDSFKANVSGPEGLEQELSGVYLGVDPIRAVYVTSDTGP